MKPIDKSKIKIVNAILAKKGLMDVKKELIRNFTSGRTERSSELSDFEAIELIALLNKDFVPNAHDLAKEKMARNVIAMAHELGWIKKIKEVTAKGIQERHDYSSLNKWMLEKSCLKKALNQYSYEELPALVTQFKQVYSYYLKKN